MTDEQKIADLLRRFSPLDGLKRDNLMALAKKVQVRELSPGQLLFKEGDTEKRTIYVVSGSLELVDADLSPLADFLPVLVNVGGNLTIQAHSFGAPDIELFESRVAVGGSNTIDPNPTGFVCP